MAMDVFERLNRKFGAWYEGLFGGGESADLRPRDILRRILAAMEDGRREGLDGKVYVPNAYTLQIAVESDDERHYLRTFLNAEELAAAVRRSVEQHGYLVRGPLVFTVEEMTPAALALSGDRVRINCRFDTVAVAPTPIVSPVETVPPPEDEDEPGTIPAVNATTLASLVVRGTDGRLQDVYPLTEHGARIGRGRQAGNDIIISGDGMISKSHCRVIYEGGAFTLRDENSSNGTYLAGERLTPGKAYPLRPGDEARIGQTLLSLRSAGGRGEAALVAPIAESPRPVAPVGGAFRLVSASGETYPLASEMSVGRSLTSDVVVIGAGVSSRHARLSLRGDTFYVEDLRTPSGTSVNGERIPPDFPVALYDGDQVGFGEVLFHLNRGGGR